MLSLAQSLSAQSLQAEPVPIYVPNPEEKTAAINDILDFLDDVLEQDNPENEQAILDFIAVLEEWLEEIDLE